MVYKEIWIMLTYKQFVNENLTSLVGRYKNQNGVRMEDIRRIITSANGIKINVLKVTIPDVDDDKLDDFVTTWFQNCFTVTRADAIDLGNGNIFYGECELEDDKDSLLTMYRYDAIQAVLEANGFTMLSDKNFDVLTSCINDDIKNDRKNEAYASDTSDEEKMILSERPSNCVYSFDGIAMFRVFTSPVNGNTFKIQESYSNYGKRLNTKPKFGKKVSDHNRFGATLMYYNSEDGNFMTATLVDDRYVPNHTDDKNKYAYPIISEYEFENEDNLDDATDVRVLIFKTK